MAQVKVGSEQSGSADGTAGLGVSLPLLATSLALLLVVAAFCFFSWHEYLRWSDQGRVSVETVAALRNLVDALEKSERSMQAYLLSGDRRYLKTGTRASAVIDEQFTELYRLNLHREQGLTSLKELRDAVKTKEADLETSKILIRENNPWAAIEGIKSGRGRLLMDRLQAIESGLEHEEQNRLNEGRTKSRRYARLQSRCHVGIGGNFHDCADLDNSHPAVDGGAHSADN